jgi:peptide/nickel transport system substrate-binding protein
MRKMTVWLGALLAFALVAAACGGTEDTTTTTAAAQTTTTSAEATTTTEAAMAFEGLSLESGGCDYGGKIESITATDEHTVVFNLCGADPAFLAKAAFVVFGIQPAEHLEATGGAPLRNPIGTGPYSLVDWVAGDSVVYERNDDYYGTVAPHQTAVLRWATESASRLLELQSGNVDGITFPSTDEYQVIEDDPNTVLVPKPEPNVLYVAMTNTFEPFTDQRVRQALAMGIDRQRIVDTFYPEGSEVADYFTPCSVQNGCEGDPWYDYDPEAAKQLLADAGYPNGFDTSIYYRDVFRGYLPEPGAVATDLQTQLKENLNINAEIVVMESGAFIEESQAGNLDGIYLLGWTGDYPHITNFLDFHFSANNPQFGDQDTSYTDPLELASKATDPVAAAPLYAEANDALKEFVPMIPIVHSTTAFAYGADVDGAYAPPWGQVLFNFMDNGEDTFVFMQNNEPISLYCSDESDGESLRACAQVIEALYSYAPDGSVQPQLAKSCTSNAELTQWTCELRDDVVFHDGSTFDANDVVVSWTAGLDAASPLHTGNTGAWTYYDYLWDGLINAPADDS